MMGKNKSLTISRRIFLPILIAMSVILIAKTIFGFHVLNTAGEVALDIRQSVEHRLLRNEIDRQVEILAHDQSQVSHWDETVNAVGSEAGHSFFREKVAGWLWKDFGIQYSIVVSPEHEAFVVLFEHGVLDAKHGREIIEHNKDLIDIAHQKYMDTRTPHEDGFKIGSHPVRSEQSIHVTAVRKVEGQIGFVAVQAIVPHEDGVLGDGLPHTLLTFKPLSNETMASMGNKLGLADLKFLEGRVSDSFDEWAPLHDDSGNNQINAFWNVNSPFPQIWSETSTTIYVSLFTIALCLTLMALRHGRVLKALHESEQKNRFMALHDHLTGLPNRLHFDDALAELLDGKSRQPIAVLCIDLDKFKAVNDTFGHHAGDQVIQTAAARIGEKIGENGLVARVGGDEFVAIITDETSREAVERAACQIIESVSRPIEVDEGTAYIGASIGVAFAPEHATTRTDVMRFADTALYEAKEAGRGQVKIFSTTDDQDRSSEMDNQVLSQAS